MCIYIYIYMVMHWLRNGEGGSGDWSPPPTISGGAPLLWPPQIYFSLDQKVFCAGKLSSVSLKKLEPPPPTSSKLTLLML